MTVNTANRRRSMRAASAHPAVVLTPGGRVLARGRAANISGQGAFVIVNCPKGPPQCSEVVIEMEVPGASSPRAGRPDKRTVRYLCRVVRTQTLGHLVGLGLQFLEKFD